MELYQKIWVLSSFLDTEHGKIACQTCHGGNPQDPDWKSAHNGVIRDPTYPTADHACGECHEKIVSKAKASLHYTLAPFKRIINLRVGQIGQKPLDQIHQAREKHCNECHSSCGQCHVARPASAGGGFLKKHFFLKTPPEEATCAGCHGARIYSEFTGENKEYAADVHYLKKMTCTSCHSAAEMHADATGIASRRELRERPRCQNCHEEVMSEKPKTEPHRIHRDRVACQVCHAQANKSCFECHVGTDKAGLQYYKCKETRFIFKIGHNPNQSIDRPCRFVVVRHSPATPNLFDAYLKDAMGDFNSHPTWKIGTPHNIQRITSRNKGCNNCHGSDALFLNRTDMAVWEQVANANVLVPDDLIPKRIAE